VPVNVKPVAHATRREAQLPTYAYQTTTSMSSCVKPQSSNNFTARVHTPRPRTAGCSPNATSTTPSPMVRRLHVPEKPCSVSMANIMSDRVVQPSEADFVTNSTAISRVYGVGTVVHRMLSGSTHCSTTWSTSDSRCARRVTSPSVSVGTSSGNVNVPAITP